MSAETIAKALGGRQAGRNWIALCPVHDDHDPSLALRDADDGKVLVHCHAGCEQAQVIGEIRARGLWDGLGSDHHLRTDQRPQPASRVPPAPDLAERTAAALKIWQSAVPAQGSLAETYLRSRGIGIVVPSAIRFHPRLKHSGGEIWPGMVAVVTRGSDGEPLAIHRTYLSRDGAGKATVSPQKMMLGPCRGGAVRLADTNGKLMVGEGIETCIAAMQATALPAWAALSTSGLRTLELPAEILEVIVLADGDDPGEAAALDAARRWKREGRAVRIARPPSGMDFNDVLLGRLACQQEGAA